MCLTSLGRVGERTRVDTDPPVRVRAKRQIGRTDGKGLVYGRSVRWSWFARRVGSIGFVAITAGCSTVDPGPTFVIPDEPFDADFFFCRVEPEVLFAKRCGPGDGSLDPANSCHFNSSAVSGMALVDHAPVTCANGKPQNRAEIGAGSAAQGNLQAASLEMSRDVSTAPIYVRPLGQNHPRAIFTPDDPAVEVLRQWAAR